jgi:hypothetical protein
MRRVQADQRTGLGMLIILSCKVTPQTPPMSPVAESISQGLPRDRGVSNCGILVGCLTGKVLFNVVLFLQPRGSGMFPQLT